MTIHLPENLEDSVRSLVQGGRFTSVDEAMAEAARLLLHKLNQVQAVANPPTSSQEPAAEAHKPIWEIIEEENRSIPPEVWDDLPTDLSAEHDHYIYGTPKRHEA